MSNYTIDNLIAASAGEGRIPAIKIGSQVFPMVTSGGGGSTDYLKCATVTSGGSTWTGYKAVLSDGVYSFESTVTSGLTYGAGFVPQVGKIYTNGALVVVDRLYQGIWIGGNILNAPMDSSQTSDGQSLITFSPTVTYNVTVGGLTGALIEYGSVKFPLNAITANFTLSGWVKATSVIVSSLLAIGGDGANSMVSVWMEEGYICIQYGSGATTTYPVSDPTAWHHYAVTKSGSTFTLYLDGVAVVTDTNSNNTITDTSLYMSGIKDWAGNYPAYTVEEAYYSYVRMHDYALTAAQIAQLAAEFTPTQA